jgi:hypothetical protein
MLNDNIAYYLGDDLIRCDVQFRKKKKDELTGDEKYRIIYGWFLRKHQYKEKEIEVIPFYKDPYMLGFISGLTFRPNCYECRYACIARCSDITLSDYWGLSSNAGFENGKGVSNVLLNTEKGVALWNMSKSRFKYEHRDIVEAIRGNGQLQAPSAFHPQHGKFAELYPQIGFKKSIDRCCRRYLIKYHIMKNVQFLKKLIK